MIMKFFKFLYLVLITASCSINPIPETKEYTYIEYYHDSTIKYQIPYENDRKNGTSYHYFSNGNIKSVVFYREDIQINDSYYYHEKDSGILKMYEFHHIDGSKIFEISYDAHHSVKEMVGIPVYIDKWESNSTFIIKDTIRFKFVVGDVPNSFIDLKYGYVHSSKNLIPLGEDVLHNESLYIEFVAMDESCFQFNDGKVFKSLFISSLYSYDSVLLMRDTIIYELKN